MEKEILQELEIGDYLNPSRSRHLLFHFQQFEKQEKQIV